MYLDLVGSRLGRFEIISERGRGGMAVVYQARQTDLERIVALKILHPNLADEETVARFHHEARSAANLDHPNIVPIYDIGELETPAGLRLHYIAMKYVEGRTVQDVLQAEGSLHLQYALEFIAPVGEALDYAHRQGVIHRDVKPSNMLVAGDGTVYLGDFGIACGTGARTGLTKTGMVMGTPEYMSPEQAEGQAEIGPASDIYALGIVLYEMLTGDYPFEADTPMAMAVARLMHSPRPMRSLRADMPPAIEDVVMRALARYPEERYGSVAEMLDALRRAAAGQPVDAMPAAYGMPSSTGPTISLEQQGQTPPPRGRSRGAGHMRQQAQRNSALFLVIAGILALFSVGGMLVFTRNSPPVAVVETPTPTIAVPRITVTPPPQGRPTPTPPQPGELVAAAGRAYANGDYETARDLYVWELNIRPRNAEALTGLGWALYQLGEYARARDVFKQSLEIEHSQSDAHNGLAWTEYADRDLQAAYSHFYQAIEFAPGNANAHYGLGLIADERDDVRQARQFYEKALQLDPDSSSNDKIRERLAQLE
jgi:serine/threonine-protein kinase